MASGNVNDIRLKTAVDVARIRRSCRIAEKVLRFLSDFVRSGVTTFHLDKLAGEIILGSDASPYLKGYKGFPGNVCASVNNVAAHGLPGDYALQEGDIVSIDVTVEKDGWLGDAAWSYIVGVGNADTRRLLRAAWLAGLAGISAAKAGDRMGDVGFAVNREAVRHGCHIAQDFVGHGIGRDMHEEPVVLHFGRPGTGMRIIPGMVFTIEPMLSLGSGEVSLMEDGWTQVTKDRSITAQFEHTIAVSNTRTEVLTFSDGRIGEYIDYPPFF